MSDAERLPDPAPFLTSAGVTTDVTGAFTVTGAVSMFSKKFVTAKMGEISLFVQGTGTGAGGTWKVLAANDYDPTRPVQKPGTFTDVSADYGAAGASTIPGTHQFAAAFVGVQNDRFSTWAWPYFAIQFQYTQTSGTEVITGQFFGGEV
jgi:hypothetical protein